MAEDPNRLANLGDDDDRHPLFLDQQEMTERQFAWTWLLFVSVASAIILFVTYGDGIFGR